jgi:hypothetical protein
MLSAEERRRLDEIERLLQQNDPAFVVRMRTGRAPKKRWPLAALVILVLGAVVPVWLVGGWQAGLIAAVVVAFLGLIVAGYRRVRRRRTPPPAPPIPPPPPPWLRH